MIHHAVDEPERELEAPGVFQQPGEPLGAGVDGGSDCRVQPAQHLLLDCFEAREIARAVIRHDTEDKPMDAAPGIAGATSDRRSGRGERRLGRPDVTKCTGPRDDLIELNPEVLRVLRAGREGGEVLEIVDEREADALSHIGDLQLAEDEP